MIKNILIWISLFYALILLGFYFFQEAIIFRPTIIPLKFNFSFPNKFEELTLQTKDRASINTIHFKVKNPKGIILYFHGNKGDLNRWGKIVLPLTNFDYDVFIMDYRGYGKSTGIRTEDKMYSDAQLCYDHILKTYNENNIIVYGRSLGGTFATYVAARNNPKQLILEATFYSMAEVIRHKLPILPYDKLLKFKFKTDQFIAGVNSPTVIFHGTEDRLVPLNLSKKLFDKSNKKNTQFIEINGATHHNIIESNLYKNAINTIFNN